MIQRSISLIGLMLVLIVTFMMIETSAQRAQRTGDITSIDLESRSFAVKTARGETSIHTTEETVYMKGDEKISFEDLKVGDHLQVIGTRATDHVLAQEVTINTD
ncbi:MAG: DUF5666 domain-containing protein [Acidobacteriota bacterium]